MSLSLAWRGSASATAIERDIVNLTSRSDRSATICALNLPHRDLYGVSWTASSRTASRRTLASTVRAYARGPAVQQSEQRAREVSSETSDIS